MIPVTCLEVCGRSWKSQRRLRYGPEPKIRDSRSCIDLVDHARKLLELNEERRHVRWHAQVDMRSATFDPVRSNPESEC